MLAVTALQLSYEVYQGAQAWKEEMPKRPGNISNQWCRT